MLVSEQWQMIPMIKLTNNITIKKETGLDSFLYPYILARLDEEKEITHHRSSQFDKLMDKYKEVGAKLFKLYKNWKSF